MLRLVNDKYQKVAIDLTVFKGIAVVCIEDRKRDAAPRNESMNPISEHKRLLSEV